MPRQLPEGIEQGSWNARVQNRRGGKELDLDILGFIGWWPDSKSEIIGKIRSEEPSRINLFVASLGGFVDDALALHDFLKAYPATVQTTIAGMTASAATVVALAGDTVRISDNALFLVHHASAGLLAFGTAEMIAESADEAVRMLRKINARLVNIYQKRTGMGKRALDELMGKEEWLSPNEAVALGFADEVFEPEPEEATAFLFTVPVAAIAAIGLPPVPEPLNTTVMPEKTKAPAPAKIPVNVQRNEPDPEPEPDPQPDPQPDERHAIARMQSELSALKAENAKLAEERRQGALASLKQALTGRVPGTAVDAIVAEADKASKGEPADVIGVLTQAANAIPTMVSTGRIPVPEKDAETTKVVNQSVAKF